MRPVSNNSPHYRAHRPLIWMVYWVHVTFFIKRAKCFIKKQSVCMMRAKLSMKCEWWLLVARGTLLWACLIRMTVWFGMKPVLVEFKNSSFEKQNIHFFPFFIYWIYYYLFIFILIHKYMKIFIFRLLINYPISIK